MTGKWIGSFIPRHVSNRVLLGGYRILSLFGVPGFIRKRHYRENGIRLEETKWAFWDMPDVYIENQAEWKKIQFGVGRHHSMSYAGCEIIAAYNAKKALDSPMSKQYMAELIRTFETRGAALWGAFGTTPTAVAAYFRKNGFSVETAYGEDGLAVDSIGRRHGVIMLMYGKEASNRKQEIDRQHYTIPNQRPKDKHYGNVHNRLWNHG